MQESIEQHCVTFIKTTEVIIFVAFVRVYSKLSKLITLRSSLPLN